MTASVFPSGERSRPAEAGHYGVRNGLELDLDAPIDAGLVADAACVSLSAEEPDRQARARAQCLRDQRIIATAPSTAMEERMRPRAGLDERVDIGPVLAGRAPSPTRREHGESLVSKLLLEPGQILRYRPGS